MSLDVRQTWVQIPTPAIDPREHEPLSLLRKVGKPVLRVVVRISCTRRIWCVVSA